MSEIIEGEAVEVKIAEPIAPPKGEPSPEMAQTIPATRIEIAVKFGDIPTVFNVLFDIPNAFLGFGLENNVEFITSRIARLMSQDQVKQEIISRIFAPAVEQAAAETKAQQEALDAATAEAQHPAAGATTSLGEK